MIFILRELVNILTSVCVFIGSIRVPYFSLARVIRIFSGAREPPKVGLLERLLRRFKTKGSLGTVHSSPCGRRMQKRKDTFASKFFAR